jgi:peptide/nickel transport system ATP-binding protein
VGETGCGKTITGLSGLCLLPKSARISAGSIRFDGRDRLALPEREMRDVGFGG